MTKVKIRFGNPNDGPALLALACDSAREAGALSLYDEEHARAHLANLLDRGVTFVACAGDQVIGAAMFTRIDAGIALLRDYESAHIFIDSRHRSIRIFLDLVDAIRRFGREKQVVMLFHGIHYLDAIRGSKEHVDRLGKLYRFAKMEGTYGITYACRPDPPS